VLELPVGQTQRLSGHVHTANRGHDLPPAGAFAGCDPFGSHERVALEGRACVSTRWRSRSTRKPSESLHCWAGADRQTVDHHAQAAADHRRPFLGFGITGIVTSLAGVSRSCHGIVRFRRRRWLGGFGGIDCPTSAS
jgi:hypothetical protein